MLTWQPGNRTFLTSLAGSALLVFLAMNDLYHLVPSAWEGVVVKVAGTLLGVSIFYLRDALKRLDEKLSSWQHKAVHQTNANDAGKSV